MSLVGAQGASVTARYCEKNKEEKRKENKWLLDSAQQGWFSCSLRWVLTRSLHVAGVDWELCTG